jgi:hypothetical protein
MLHLYVICEGDDDERFFDAIIKPRLPQTDVDVRYFQYAQQTHEDVRNLVRSVHGMQENGLDADYLFFRDFDQAPSKEARLEQIRRQYEGVVERDRTFLVIQMIEGWYVAGLANQHSVPGLDDAPPQTNDFVKQDLDNLIQSSATRQEVLQDIPRHFDVARARTKNRSFDDFCTAVLD